MANTLYPKYKESTAECPATGTGLYVALVDTVVYTYNAAHQFYSDLSGIIGADQEVLSKAQINCNHDGDDISLATVTQAVIIYRKTSGANTTWPLIAYIDTGVTGLHIKRRWYI